MSGFITLYISGDQTQAADFYLALNSFCVSASIVFVVIDVNAICSYDLDTTEKSDAFYAELVRLLTIYTSLNFTIV